MAELKLMLIGEELEHAEPGLLGPIDSPSTLPILGPLTFAGNLSNI